MSNIQSLNEQEKFFTLTMNKIFIRASKIMRQMAMGTFEVADHPALITW